MKPKCPGQDDRYVKAEIHKCPQCGYKVEIFSDEVKTKCPQCKNLVYRQKLHSCIDWCKAARECIGEDKWKQLRGKKTNN